MLLERPANGFVDRGFVQREAAEIPDAVAQLGTAGVKRGGGEIEMPVHSGRIGRLGALRGTYLHRNAREVLRDGVVQLHGEPRAFPHARIDLGLGDDCVEAPLEREPQEQQHK